MGMLGSSAQVFSEQALQLAEEHGTPPEPQAYELWYVYATRTNQKLNEEIDLLRAAGAPFSRETIKRLLSNYVVGDDPSEGLLALGAEVDDNMGAIGERIVEEIGVTQSFESSLRQLSGGFLGARGAGDLDRQVTDIVSANAQYLGAIQKFRDEMDAAHRQIRSLREEMAELTDQANSDEMTGLLNRRSFLVATHKALARWREGGPEFAVALADIDNFRAVNESFGHAMGDEVLKKFAQVARKSVRPSDLVSRFGGEEFAFLFPGVSARAGHVIADRIRQYFMAIRFLDPRRDRRLERVTVSFGVSGCEKDESADMLIKRLEAQLTSAKRGGRNRVMSPA
ncbi:MAG: GGDEF domain-containing protein [Pseudomonadota bacterium]